MLVLFYVVNAYSASVCMQNDRKLLVAVKLLNPDQKRKEMLAWFTPRKSLEDTVFVHWTAKHWPVPIMNRFSGNYMRNKLKTLSLWWSIIGEKVNCLYHKVFAFDRVVRTYKSKEKIKQAHFYDIKQKWFPYFK